MYSKQFNPNKNYSLDKKSHAAPIPNFRRLRGYAFDPSLSIKMETSLINEIVFKVDWEGTDAYPLQPGPSGEYIEVVDHDPASHCFYDPVDLNHPFILAQDGLSPAEGNPQFHQQMVYAVAMTTIKNFERALGRKVMWAPKRLKNEDGSEEWRFIPKLRIYPHGLRQANAYYSPTKLALLFGYFPASPETADQHIPGGTVFTCLSHDIIAHETTHAILDGMHNRFIEPVHPDNLAFHEAFSDIVALFQHFTFPEVLRHQIAKTRGDLSSQNLLGQLAQEFGKAIGSYGALRDALGTINPETKQWEMAQPNPNDYLQTMEPHARGSILVGAIFDAFIAIYNQRVADLLRIATDGTGILKAGALHPDLVNRLATEASKTARHVLSVCIRGLDYCPPNEMNFGDYLRALITMDNDLVPDDEKGYRVAFIEAFKRRGIYPRNVRSLSIESLRWKKPEEIEFSEVSWVPPAEDLKLISQELRNFIARYGPLYDRSEIFKYTNEFGGFIHYIIGKYLRGNRWFEEVTGLVLSKERCEEIPGINKDRNGFPVYQVHNVQQAKRIGPSESLLDQLIISVTQKRVIYDEELGADFNFRGGATIIIDMNDLKMKYAIKRRIDDEKRLATQLAYRKNSFTQSLKKLYFDTPQKEPFMALHSS